MNNVTIDWVGDSPNEVYCSELVESSVIMLNVTVVFLFVHEIKYVHWTSSLQSLKQPLVTPQSTSLVKVDYKYKYIFILQIKQMSRIYFNCEFLQFYITNRIIRKRWTINTNTFSVSKIIQMSGFFSSWFLQFYITNRLTKVMKIKITYAISADHH